jgi:hypothetical protein
LSSETSSGTDKNYGEIHSVFLPSDAVAAPTNKLINESNPHNGAVMCFAWNPEKKNSPHQMRKERINYCWSFTGM